MKLFGFNITISKRNYAVEAEHNLQMRRGLEAVLFRPEVFTAYLASAQSGRKHRGKKKGRAVNG